MDSAFLLAITLIGLLLIVQVLSLGTAMKSVLWVILAFVFGPFIFQALKTACCPHNVVSCTSWGRLKVLS